MDQELQIIEVEGVKKIFTKPPEPVEIPTETVQGWLAEMQSAKASAIVSKESTAEAQDATIAHFTEKEAVLQDWLEQIAE